MLVIGRQDIFVQAVLNIVVNTNILMNKFYRDKFYITQKKSVNQ